jgi:mRNA-degrading endonuclease RelE of RelBE toxin-antitoxin system
MDYVRPLLAINIALNAVELLAITENSDHRKSQRLVLSLMHPTRSRICSKGRSISTENSDRKTLIRIRHDIEQRHHKGIKGAFRALDIPKAERFLKKLKKKNSVAASVIATQILELKRDPYTSLTKCDIVKVAGHVNEYRLRIGKVRAEYTINEDEINIRTIFIKKRKSDYR